VLFLIDPGKSPNLGTAQSKGKLPYVKRTRADAIGECSEVKAALAKVAAIKSTRETASDDDKDRFFARGRYARA
jgi:hypothetical protein